MRGRRSGDRQPAARRRSRMKGARGLLISITGGTDLTLFEVDEAATRIREEVDPDANIILGATFDESLEGIIRVSVVATGIDQRGRPRRELAVDRAPHRRGDRAPAQRRRASASRRRRQQPPRRARLASRPPTQTTQRRAAADATGSRRSSLRRTSRRPRTARRSRSPGRQHRARLPPQARLRRADAGARARSTEPMHAADELHSAAGPRTCRSRRRACRASTTADPRPSAFSSQSGRGQPASGSRQPEKKRGDPAASALPASALARREEDDAAGRRPQPRRAPQRSRRRPAPPQARAAAAPAQRRSGRAPARRHANPPAPGAGSGASAAQGELDQHGRPAARSARRGRPAGNSGLPAPSVELKTSPEQRLTRRRPGAGIRAHAGPCMLLKLCYEIVTGSREFDRSSVTKRKKA